MDRKICKDEKTKTNGKIYDDKNLKHTTLLKFCMVPMQPSDFICISNSRLPFQTSPIVHPEKKRCPHAHSSWY